MKHVPIKEMHLVAGVEGIETAQSRSNPSSQDHTEGEQPSCSVMDYHSVMKRNKPPTKALVLQSARQVAQP